MQPDKAVQSDKAAVVENGYPKVKNIAAPTV